MILLSNNDSLLDIGQLRLEIGGLEELARHERHARAPAMVDDSPGKVLQHPWPLLQPLLHVEDFHLHNQHRL